MAIKRRVRKIYKSLPPHTNEAFPLTNAGEANKALIIGIIAIVCVIGLSLLLFFTDTFVGKAITIQKISPAILDSVVLGPSDILVELGVPSSINVGDTFWVDVFLTTGELGGSVSRADIFIDLTNGDAVRFTGTEINAIGKTDNYGVGIFKKEAVSFRRDSEGSKSGIISANYIEPNQPAVTLKPKVKYYLASLQMKAVGTGSFSLKVDNVLFSTDNDPASTVDHLSGKYNVKVKDLSSRCSASTVAFACQAAGKNCGSLPDSCGGTLSCGTCAEGTICAAQNICVAVTTGLQVVDTCTESPAGLVGWWNAEDSFSDMSWNGADLSGNSAAISPDKAVGAGSFIFFSSGKEYMTADSVSNSMDTGEFSFGAWIKPVDDVIGTVLAFNTASGGNKAMLFWSHTDATTKIGNTLSYYDGAYAVTSRSFSANEWHHVMVTVDTQNVAHIYVDGNDELSFTSSSTRPTTGDKFSIGQEWDGKHPSDFFNGFIDEAMVFNKALTAEEVRAIYNAGDKGMCEVSKLLGDSDNSGCISSEELFDFIDLFYNNKVNPDDVFSVIDSWYTLGCQE